MWRSEFGESTSKPVPCTLLAGERLKLDEALLLVKAARPCACPNSGFMRQLDVFAAAVHSPAAEAQAPEEDTTALC